MHIWDTGTGKSILFLLQKVDRRWGVYVKCTQNTIQIDDFVQLKAIQTVEQHYPTVQVWFWILILSREQIFEYGVPIDNQWLLYERNHHYQHLRSSAVPHVVTCSCSCRLRSSSEDQREYVVVVVVGYYFCRSSRTGRKCAGGCWRVRVGKSNLRGRLGLFVYLNT